MRPKPVELSADSFNTTNGTGWIIFSDRGLRALKLPKTGAKQPAGTRLKKTNISKMLEAYFKGKKTVFDAKIDWSQYSEFEKKTLAGCAQIKYGEKISYKELARKIKSDKAFRAVGNALNKNRLPVIIPCHRIVRSDGSPGGFASGETTKKRLLELEKI